LAIFHFFFQVLPLDLICSFVSDAVLLTKITATMMLYSVISKRTFDCVFSTPPFAQSKATELGENSLTCYLVFFYVNY